MSDSSKSIQELLTQSRKKKQRGQYLEEYGKVPPQAIELEEAVLGALMLDKDAINHVLDVLKADSFYKPEHQEVFEAALQLFEDQQPIDILTITNTLRQRGKLDFVGGPYFISSLTNRVASAANIEYHARIVAQKHLLRELIRISGDVQQQAYDDTTDVFDLLDFTEKELFNVTSGNIRTQYESLSTLISKAITHIEEIKEKTNGLSGVPSGFSNLDRLTSGWQQSDLIIVAARPGMGKTSFILALARNAAVDFGMPMAIFSLEMSSIQLVNRLISAEAEIEATKLRSGQLEPYEWEQLHTKIHKLTEAPIFIDDTPALNIFELRAKCRRLKTTHNIQMVIIDYLQLMQGKSDNRNTNREQEISSISRALKGMAKELQIPVIALSQLSRDVEKRGGSKRPILSDLRESGSIEQDADQVLFLFRPEYYGMEQDEEGRPTQGLAEVIIAKNRHGSVETVHTRWVGKFAKFVEMDGIMELPEDPGSDTITRSSRINDEYGEENDNPF